MPEEATPQEQPFLVIYNYHFPSCGEPPSYVLKPDTPGYYGYYQNEHGEQWVFVYDYATETGTVRGGDAGWERSHTVVNGYTPDLVLRDEEKMWVFVCWETARAGKAYRDEKRARQE